MILTYPSYLDQSQIIGLNTILDYHGSVTVTPYPLSIALSHSVEYNIALSHSVEYNIALSHSVEYNIALSHSVEYNIALSQSGGGS